MIANIEKYLVELGDTSWKLLYKKTENHFVGYYSPAMEKTPSLEKYLVSWYQSLIGMLKCMV